jgi:hypothetical protein
MIGSLRCEVQEEKNHAVSKIRPVENEIIE